MTEKQKISMIFVGGDIVKLYLCILEQKMTKFPGMPVFIYTHMKSELITKHSCQDENVVFLIFPHP